MDAILSLIAETPPAEYLRSARWGYAAVNGLHILGLSLLIGAVVALDLRLIGFWKHLPIDPFTELLPRVAMTGLALAVVTGLLLFSVRPADYAANPVFLIKMLLVAAGTLFALTAHWNGLLRHGNRATLRLLGLTSLCLWIPALFLGRLIAFTGDS